MGRKPTFASRRACVVAAALVSGCAAAHPENPALDAFPPGVAGVTEVTYYDIHGRTASELVAEMRKLGPKTASGGVFFGETTSPVRWTTPVSWCHTNPPSSDNAFSEAAAW